MRNPKRIHQTMEKVEQFWRQHPDWRLGQLVVNVCRDESETQIFNIEDDAFMARLLAMQERLNG